MAIEPAGAQNFQVLSPLHIVQCTMYSLPCTHAQVPECERLPDQSEVYKLQQLRSCRAQKLVDTTMAELGVPGPPAVPTRATCGAYLALRAEVIAMLEMRKTLQHR